MAKKPSFDTAKIKEFLIKKGERIGLGAAGAISLLLLVMTFLGITTRPPASAGAPSWDVAFNKTAKTTQGLIASSQPTPIPEKKPLFAKNPPPAIAHAEDSAPFDPLHYEPNDKKRLPPVMLVSAQAKEDVQVDVLRAPALTYKVDFTNQRILASDRHAVKFLEPKRMVVVTATFSYEDQLKAFAAALQFAKLDELRKSKDAPHFLGLNIYRVEVFPDKEDPNPVKLYVYDPEKKQTVVHKPLDEFFRSMVIDTANPAQIGAYLGPNMATPVPYMASVTPDTAEKYPPLKISGFEQPEGTEDDGKSKPQQQNTGGTMPLAQAQGGTGKAGSQERLSNPVPIPWSKLRESELRRRLDGNYNVFHPLGRPEHPESKDGKKTDKAPEGPQGAAVDVSIAADATKLLIRFIDIDLEIGKTYRYWIQVRVANPNYGKANEVAAQGWATLAELPQPETNFAGTPPVTLKGDIHYYAYDQAHASKQGDWPFKSSKGIPNSAADAIHMVSDTITAVQVHRWIDRTLDREIPHVIGDWAVAERLMVRRGDPLGREVFAEVPEWDLRHSRFVLGKSTAGPKKKGESYIPIKFYAENRPTPLLVDFQGGNHRSYRTLRTTSSAGTLSDNAELELLILDENGKLILRNSTDDEADTVRLQHYARWASRLDKVRPSSSGRGGTNTGPPGLRSGPPGLR